MRRRVIFAGLAATGGLVSSVVLQVAVAAADVSAAGAVISSQLLDIFSQSADHIYV
jgi:hypothetical protein